MVEDEFGASSAVNLVVRFTEIFENYAPYYIAMGMTYDEFWNDDVEKAKTYKQAFMLKKKQQNERLWLQGVYIYKALERIFPLFNPWVEKEPMPYLEEPLPLSEKDVKEQEINREKREMEKIRDYLELQVRKGEKQEG